MCKESPPTEEMVDEEWRRVCGEILMGAINALREMTADVEETAA